MIGPLQQERGKAVRAVQRGVSPAGAGHV